MTREEYFTYAFVVTLVLLVGYPLYLWIQSAALSRREKLAEREASSADGERP
jgi:hypothetical protein